jgi:hypothetical protein
VLRIGTNNSYKKRWSPIWAGADRNALRRDYRRARAFAYNSASKPEKSGLTRKQVTFIPHTEAHPVCRVGSFAYWLAARVFRAEAIYLIGFDMETAQGHFDGPAEPRDYSDTRDALRQHWERLRVPTWIWRGEFVPLETIL